MWFTETNVQDYSDDSIMTSSYWSVSSSIYILLFVQVIFGKSSCAEFMNEAYTPIIYHNK